MEKLVNCLITPDRLSTYQKEIIRDLNADQSIDKMHKKNLTDALLNPTPTKIKCTSLIAKTLGNNLEPPIAQDKLVNTFKQVRLFKLIEEKKPSAATPASAAAALPQLDQAQQGRLLQKYDVANSEKIAPRILEFDVSKDSVKSGHTMDVKKYMENRVSEATIEKIKEHPENTEFFLGELSEMKQFYGMGEPPLTYVGQLGGPSSTKFHLFENKDNPGEFKIVMNGIGSETRLNHQCLQLKYSGVDISKIQVRGNFRDMYETDFKFLKSTLSPFAERNIPMTCVMGNRWFPMEFLGKLVHPELADASEGAAYNKLKPTQHQQGALCFDTVEIDTNAGKALVIAFRMPNGSLAHATTEALLESGVDSMIMGGAGGSLSPDSHVGDYQTISEASYAGKNVILPPEVLVRPDVKGTSLDGHLKPDGKNVTVDSPLEEDQKWLNDSRESSTVVDVESQHILRAVMEHNSAGKADAKQVKVVAGLFISDVVGEHPLEGKIDTANAYVQLQPFLDQAYTALGIKVTPKS